MADYKMFPIKFTTTGAQDIADGYISYPFKLVGHGIKSIKITASQNADPGEDHLVKFNSSECDAIPMVDGESLSISISDTLPEKYSIREVFIKAGKNATSFKILGVG